MMLMILYCSYDTLVEMSETCKIRDEVKVRSGFAAALI